LRNRVLKQAKKSRIQIHNANPTAVSGDGEEARVEELTEAELEDLEVNRIVDQIHKDEL
jgi:hypothetical protein